MGTEEIPGAMAKSPHWFPEGEKNAVHQGEFGSSGVTPGFAK